MLFLVKGRVSKSAYMGDTTTEEALRLVEAKDAEEASTKFENHYISQSSEYSVYYMAEVDDVSSVIA